MPMQVGISKGIGINKGYRCSHWSRYSQGVGIPRGGILKGRMVGIPIW